ncbi:hypothetical protein [Bartonella sp. CB178]|uniref:hypothetical protein n=1 Tax=Bartonella sp. CB178 TaxID=3112255 RepID=UPI00300E6AF0
MMKKVFLLVTIASFLGAGSVLAAECTKVGREIATQQRGVLLRSKSVVQDGRDMCVVVVVVPARDGKNLRRIEIFVPAD